MSLHTKHKSKSSAGQLISFMPDSYLDRTARPIYAIAFLLAFIIFYEIGTFIISPQALTLSYSSQTPRVVSFLWLQNLLSYVGFSQAATWLAAPLAVIVILLAMQITSHNKWYVSFRDFLPMAIECIILSIPLIILSLLLNQSAPPQAAALASSSQSAGANPLFVEIVTAIGAGIYEELVFRLILICLLMIVFQDIFGLSRSNAILFSVIVSAALFSGHHHFYFVNGKFAFAEAFSVSRFAFRTIAGIYFAGLFAVRGFAITAGCHAFYDIIAACLNAAIFDAAT